MRERKKGDDRQRNKQRLGNVRSAAFNVQEVLDNEGDKGQKENEKG